MVTGAVVGAAAMATWTMMNKSAQKKMGRFAVQSAQKMADNAGQIFGK